MFRRIGWILLALPLCIGVAAAHAQDPSKTNEPKSTDQDPRNPGLWNTDAMMENAVQQLSRRYNLTPEQEEVTRLFLTSRVRRFLRDNEGELRGLLVDLMQVQFNPNSATPEQMQEWARRAQPMLVSVKKAIMDGNDEWLSKCHLTAEQKRTYQRDRDQMDVTFLDLDEKFGRWADGGFKKEDLYPKPPQRQGSDVRPGGTRRGSGLTDGASIETDRFAIIVNNLIVQYEFDEGQKNAAAGILKEFRGKRDRYLKANKAKLDDLDKRKASWRKAADPQEELKRISEATTRLMEPVTVDMEKALTDRVTALATAKQIAGYQAKRDKQAAHNEAQIEAAKRKAEAMKENGGRPKEPEGANNDADKPATNATPPATQPS